MVVGTCLYSYYDDTLIHYLFPDPRCDIELWAHIHFTSMCSSLGICDRSSTPTIKVRYCFLTWWNYGLLSMTHRHSDREGERCKHITFSLLFGIAGFMLAMSTMNKIIRYCSLWVSSLFPSSSLKCHTQDSSWPNPMAVRSAFLPGQVAQYPIHQQNAL